MGHSRLAPSGATRWMVCAGSVRDSERYPDTSSEAADLGTCAHALLAYCLANWLDPMSFIGQVMTTQIDDKNVEFDIDADMAEAVKEAYNYVYNRVTNDGCTLYIEAKVSPFKLGREDLGGTADIVLVNSVEIEIADYKHGIGIVVESHNNRQTQIYGLGVLDTLGLSLIDPVRLLRTTIIQPRAFHEAGSIRSSTYSEPEVRTFAQEILAAAIRTDDPNATLVAGEEQCRFCPCKSGCGEVARTSLVAAQAIFQDLTDTTSAEIEQRMLVPPGDLTPEQFTMVLQNETLIRGFLTAVHDKAVALLKEGGDVGGFKLIAGKKSSAWGVKDEDVVAKLRTMKKASKDGKAHRVSMDDIHNTVIKSPAQIRKLLKSQLTEKAMEKVEDLISTSTGNPQLAPASSSKPAVNTKAAQVFEDLSTPSFLL